MNNLPKGFIAPTDTDIDPFNGCIGGDWKVRQPHWDENVWHFAKDCLIEGRRLSELIRDGWIVAKPAPDYNNEMTELEKLREENERLKAGISDLASQLLREELTYRTMGDYGGANDLLDVSSRVRALLNNEQVNK
jgi:hypothetical protein